MHAIRGRNGNLGSPVTWLIWGVVISGWAVLLLGVAVGLAVAAAGAALFVVAPEGTPQPDVPPPDPVAAPILCQVIPAEDVRVGDLIDGWLRVEMVEAGVFEHDVIHMVTRDGQFRVSSRTRCVVLRSSFRAA